MRNSLIALLLIGVVALSGCIGQSGGTGGAGAGVVISSFAPDISSIEGGQKANFQLIVKNVGERQATNVKAELMGLSSDWPNAPTGFQAVSPSSLNPADPTVGAAGEEGFVEWPNIIAPTGKSVDVTYDISVRLHYQYDTSSVTTVRIATRDYYRTVTQPGQQAQQTFGIVSSKTTGGPLVVTPKMRVPYVESGTRAQRVQFEIQNAGSGRTYLSSDIGKPTNSLDKITVTVDDSDCTNKEVKLVGGKSAIVYCNVNLGSVTNYVEKTITFTAGYSYYADSATSVTILKKESTVVTDTTPPTVTVSHTPTNPKTTDDVIVTATASDPSGIKKITIYYNNTPTNLVSTPKEYSSPYRTSETFTHTISRGAFVANALVYYNATAEDALGYLGKSATLSFTITAGGVGGLG